MLKSVSPMDAIGLGRGKIAQKALETGNSYHEESEDSPRTPKISKSP
jgi:hypothetical protein